MQYWCNIGAILILLLGVIFHRKILDAVREMAVHTIGHQELEQTLHEDSIAEWMAAIELWEADTSLPNPFEVASSGTTSVLID